MPDRFVIDFGTTFDRSTLLHAANSIEQFPEPRVVHWKLENLETVPWMDLLFVADIIARLKPVAKQKIVKSLVVLPGPNWQYAVDSLFSLAPPSAPCEIFSERLPMELQEDGGVSEQQQQQQRSAPRSQLRPPRQRLLDLGGSAPPAPSVSTVRPSSSS